jgi:hypothetical protein
VAYFRLPRRGAKDELNLGIDARTGEVRGDAYVPPSIQVEKPKVGAPTALGAYPIAEDWAREWQFNAFLEELFMVIPGDQFDSGPPEITYWFLADRAFGPFRWRDSAHITVDTQEGKVVKVETGRSGGQYMREISLGIDCALLDSSDALRMAEALGGKAYREKYADARVSIATEEGPCLGEMFWSVTYFIPPQDGAYDDLNFGIDARTGEVRRDAYVPPSIPGKETPSAQ